MTDTTQRMNSAVEDRASADDRQWFIERPDRRYRLRLRLTSELGSNDDTTHVLVTQISPGVRIRSVIRCLGEALPPDRDDQLARLAELLHAGELAYVLDGRVMGFNELPVRACWGRCQ